jgi:hypothetical protein
MKSIKLAKGKDHILMVICVLKPLPIDFYSPNDQLHHLQLSNLQSDKESIKLKLQQVQKKIASLEIENVDLRVECSRASGKTKNGNRQKPNYYFTQHK